MTFLKYKFEIEIFLYVTVRKVALKKKMIKRKNK